MNNDAQTKPKVECKKFRLAEAISDGRLYQTKMILEDNPHLNYLDKQGLSPLMRAFLIEDEKRRTRIAMVKLLLLHNVDVNLKDSEQRHVLTRACRMNQLDLIKLLFANCLQDIELTAQDLQGNTPLMYAVQNNNITMVGLVVNAMRKFSLSVDQRNCEDKTAYYKAIELGFEECARILTDIGKASRGIKVNPFLDFLGIDNSDCYGEVRVNSVPVTKDCVSTRGLMVARRHAVGKRKNTQIGDGTRRVSSNKKRTSRLTKSGKVHSEAMQTKQGECKKNLKGSESPRSDGVLIRASNVKTKSCPVKRDRILTESSVGVISEFIGRPSQGRNGKYSSDSPGGQSSPFDQQDRFLRLILDETRSEEIGRRSRSPMSCISTNPASRNTSPINSSRQKRIVPILNSFLKSPERKDFKTTPGVLYTATRSTRVSGYKPTRTEPNDSAYRDWKASTDHPPNSLRNLLALRAEQQSEISSYRKGLMIPKYEPCTDDAEDRSAVEVLSSVSEHSGRSEASKKMIAVAKTIGLSVYLANKRKGANKKD